MNWLRKTIDEHNKRLTYADYEEHWTVTDWICSLIFLTLVSVVPLIIIALQRQQPVIAVVGCGLGALVVWCHFWNILH